MVLSNWFLPHKDTHQKARLISWEALLIYILFFISLQVIFSVVSYAKPGILGISSNIDQKRLIELTNTERAKSGLAAVSENSTLNQAAYAKAKNMFEENYWAHFAPSGKTPWDFILGVGYKFSYAGENLAKNFSTSEEVVGAWMNSPSHKDNLLSSKYKEIGIAVVDGILDGQQTTLVVQMFGSSSSFVAKAEVAPPQPTATPAQTSLTLQTQPPATPIPQPQITISGEEVKIPPQELEKQRTQPVIVASVQEQSPIKPLFNPYQILKSSGLTLISFLFIFLILDFIILFRRGIFKLHTNHIAHMSLLAISAAMLLSSNSGAIL